MRFSHPEYDGQGMPSHAVTQLLGVVFSLTQPPYFMQQLGAGSIGQHTPRAGVGWGAVAPPTTLELPAEPPEVPRVPSLEVPSEVPAEPAEPPDDDGGAGGSPVPDESSLPPQAAAPTKKIPRSTERERGSHRMPRLTQRAYRHAR